MSTPGLTGHSALVQQIGQYARIGPSGASRSGPMNRLPTQKSDSSVDDSGPAAWRALENACNILNCQSCASECRRLINGLHDLVNVKLGRALHRPDDFDFLWREVRQAHRDH